VLMHDVSDDLTYHASLYVFNKLEKTRGVEGVVRGLEGIHLVDGCILTELE
jgi:hypothetical protein